MRRRDLVLGAFAGTTLAARGDALQARPVPSSGDRLPAVGLGTWLTFDVSVHERAALARRRAVVERFFAEGGRLIDASPMYGHAEAVLGEVLARPEPRLFSATKVWTPLDSYGPTQMRRSLALWRLARVDLMQVHNLLNWRAHLPTLRAWKADGLVRHIGVTTSHGSAHDEMQRVIDGERGIDFMQITYNPVDRRAEPLMERAAGRGIAVIANRPFDGGALLERLTRMPLPGVAAELGCEHWATLVLKWELAHPAVTVAIPATTNPEHVAQNLGALRGPLPDAVQREAIRRAMAPALG